MPLFKPENVNTPVLSQFSLKGKIAVVTGGAKGIGLEIVRGLAEAGADVALLYGTSHDAAAAAAAEISAATGQRISTYSVDVANRAQTAEIIQKVADEFGGGRLDVVVANAGVCASIPALEVCIFFSRALHFRNPPPPFWLQGGNLGDVSAGATFLDL